jgi:hypothetical protein
MLLYHARFFRNHIDHPFSQLRMFELRYTTSHAWQANYTIRYRGTREECLKRAVMAKKWRLYEIKSSKLDLIPEGSTRNTIDNELNYEQLEERIQSTRVG